MHDGRIVRIVVVVLGLWIVGAWILSAHSSNPQLDRPTPPDRYDRIEQQMLGVHPGIRMFDVLTTLGKPDYSEPFTYGWRSGSHGLRVYRVRCLTYVGGNTWMLCFDNYDNPTTFRLVSKRRV